LIASRPGYYATPSCRINSSASATRLVVIRPSRMRSMVDLVHFNAAAVKGSSKSEP
jgi:hypothetical protein